MPTKLAIILVAIAVLALVAIYAWTQRTVLEKSKDGKLRACRQPSPDEIKIIQYDPGWGGSTPWRTIKTIIGDNRKDARRKARLFIEKHKAGQTEVCQTN